MRTQHEDNYNFWHNQMLGMPTLKPAFSYARRAGAWLGSPPVETVATRIPAARIRATATAYIAVPMPAPAQSG